MARKKEEKEKEREDMNKVKEKIISTLTCYRDCWQILAAEDSLYLMGKVEAMDTAIRIVKDEFDKESEERNSESISSV